MPHPPFERKPHDRRHNLQSVFYEFPARGYLEKYYSAVGPENSAFVRSITDYLGTRDVATGRVIEVAGGPCLYSLMALMASRGRPFEHVTFTDVGWKNLREVDCWLRDDPSQFDYGSAELVAFLGKLSDLGRPGATLLTSFICRSAGYTIHERDFPAFAVDESSIFAYLDRAGVELEDVEVRSVASEDLASDPGYEGLLFVAGRLPG